MNMNKYTEIKRIESLIAAGVSKDHEYRLRCDLARISETSASVSENSELIDLESEYNNCQDERLKKLFIIEIKELKASILSKKKEQLEFDIAIAVSKLMLEFQNENSTEIKYLNIHLDEQSNPSFVSSVDIEL